MRLPILLILLALAAAGQKTPELPGTAPVLDPAAGKWKIRYFYDENKSQLALGDFAFAGARYGIAAGAMVDERGKAKGTALITRDGGLKWTLTPLQQQAISVFPLGDGRFFIVTAKALYYTDEGGVKFDKRKAPEGLLRVYFLDDNKGFGVGEGKIAWRTADGGRSWTKIPESEALNVTGEWSGLNCVEFVTDKVGMIAGNSKRSTMTRYPGWMDPERAARRRQTPSTVIALQTHDGGETWQPQLSSVFGLVTRLRLSPVGYGLALWSYGDDFDWPAEVVEMDLRTGKSHPIFRRKDVNITDVLIREDGSTVLAGVQPPGKLHDTPLPGKVRVFTSPDRKAWTEYEVDYKAFAHRAMLARAGESVYVSTDTGMILYLDKK